MIEGRLSGEEEVLLLLVNEKSVIAPLEYTGIIAKIMQVHASSTLSDDIYHVNGDR